MLNLDIARKVLDYITHERKGFRFDMDDWYSESKPGDRDDGFCGTSACLAGTAVYLHPEMSINYRYGNPDPRVNGRTVSWEVAGAKALGMSDDDHWPFYLDDDDAIDWLKDRIAEAEAELAAQQPKLPKPLKVEHLVRDDDGNETWVPEREAIHAQ